RPTPGRTGAQQRHATRGEHPATSRPRSGFDSRHPLGGPCHEDPSPPRPNGTPRPERGGPGSHPGDGADISPHLYRILLTFSSHEATEHNEPSGEPGATRARGEIMTFTTLHSATPPPPGIAQQPTVDPVLQQQHL